MLLIYILIPFFYATQATQTQSLICNNGDEGEVGGCAGLAPSNTSSSSVAVPLETGAGGVVTNLPKLTTDVTTTSSIAASGTNPPGLTPISPTMPINTSTGYGANYYMEDNSCVAWQDIDWTYQKATYQMCSGICQGADLVQYLDNKTYSVSCVGNQDPPQMVEGAMAVPGNCTCNDPLMDFLADTFMNAIVKISKPAAVVGKVIEVFEIVAEVGAAFAFPEIGAGIDGALIAVINAAKIAQYTYDSGSLGAQAFRSWALANIGKAPDDYTTAFDVFRNADDKLIPGEYRDPENIAQGSGRAGDEGCPECDVDNPPFSDPPGYESAPPEAPPPDDPPPPPDSIPEPGSEPPLNPGEAPKEAPPEDPNEDPKDPDKDGKNKDKDKCKEKRSPAGKNGEDDCKKPSSARKPSSTQAPSSAPRHSTTGPPSSLRPSTTEPPSSDPNESTAQSSRTRKPRSRKSKSSSTSGHTLTTITTIVSSSVKLKPITQVCAASRWPQACFHYDSAIRQGMEGTFTCSDNFDKERPSDLPYTASWYQEHAGPLWRDYATKDYMWKGVKDPVSTSRAISCAADEWPPAMFLEKKSSKSQLVRYIPDTHNSGAGSLWRGFCADYDGGRGNGAQDSSGVLHSSRMKHNQLTIVGPGSTSSTSSGTTTTVYVKHSAEIDRAVFTMSFDWSGGPLNNQAPSAQNEWGLRENPCWPEAIVPDNPGWNLLNDDPWYNTHPQAAKDRHLYPQPPDTNQLAAARQWLQNHPNYITAGPNTGINRPKKATPTQQATALSQSKAPNKRPAANQGGRAGKQQKTGTKPPRRARHLLRMRDSGRFALHDLHQGDTRILSDEEVQKNVEVIECRERDCNAERRAIQETEREDPDEDGEPDEWLFIRGQIPAMSPPKGVEAKPTATPVVFEEPEQQQVRTLPSAFQSRPTWKASIRF